MTKAEAERFARSCLYNYRENTARLEQKIFKYEIAKEKGSRIEQQFRERGGKASASYIDSVPDWLEATELLEAQIYDLRLCVEPVQRLLKDLGETQQEAMVIYKLRYEQRLSWEKAKIEARDEYNIGSRAFWERNNDLIERVIRYLDLDVGPETQPETQPEMRLENTKKAV
jgi:hypothetical protein